ncbi:spore coat protein [Hathewaya limosa]|uniref:Spore coat protein CotF n=1 Tax=Hathewaya limosa TaxID=1536 RepID=A0ABU0JU22_HATLI|nr:spore coat protein [Hathewaya limosa]MDQ0480601.1 spore coat protein CotF [Hathewaya limosa]
MQEKSMLNDYLSTINSSLSGYASVIAQTDNQELRQQFQLMRDQDENRQYKIYQMAKQKGFYKPAEAATQTQISTVKSELTTNK